MVIPDMVGLTSRAQRPAARAGAGIGKYGRSQARRIRPDAHFKAHSGDKKVTVAE